MLSIPTTDLGIWKASDKNYPFSVAGASGVIDITSDDLYFYVKLTADGDPVITKTSADSAEIEKTDPTNGELLVKLSVADTSSLDSGKYTYSLWHDDGTTLQPIATGYFWITNIGPNLVEDMRSKLDEAGELRRQVVKDAIVYPATTGKLYLPRTRILSVEGIFLLADETHVLTDYYDGGGFSRSTGEVWLGTLLPNADDHVRVNYTWESGLSDAVISHHLSAARLFTITYTGIEFEYGSASTSLQQGAEAMSFAGAVLGSILTANGANVAQMGYNFRLDEFEIQTKLWGEGMIAEALFNMYIREYDKWRMSLGKAGTILLATPTVEKYDIVGLVGYTDSSSEGGEGF